MAEETTNAASSPAEVADVFNGETPTLAEFNSYRESGEVPGRFKPAEPAAPAPADAPEQTVETPEPETESESDAEEAQEPPQKPVSPAEKRIKQLLADKKELQRKLDAAANQTNPGSSPAQAQPVAQPLTGPEPTVDDKKADGTLKFDTYEEYVKALARWTAREERAAMEREYAERQAQDALKVKFDEASERYENAEEVIVPTAKTIMQANIPPIVKKVFEDSDVFIDLCYVVGSDQKELKKFIALAETNPRMAIGKVFEYERAIKEELAGKTAVKAPEKQSTQAPKPPSPVGGGSSRAFDANDDDIPIDTWHKKRNAQLGIK